MSFTLHSESFASTCLSIGKYSAVITCQHFVNQWGGNNFVDIYLLGIGPKDPIKAKILCQGTFLNHLHFFIVASWSFNHNG